MNIKFIKRNILLLILITQEKICQWINTLQKVKMETQPWNYDNSLGCYKYMYMFMILSFYFNCNKAVINNIRIH